MSSKTYFNLNVHQLKDQKDQSEVNPVVKVKKKTYCH